MIINTCGTIRDESQMSLSFLGKSGEDLSIVGEVLSIDIGGFYAFKQFHSMSIETVSIQCSAPVIVSLVVLPQEPFPRELANWSAVSMFQGETASLFLQPGQWFGIKARQLTEKPAENVLVIFNGRLRKPVV